AHDSRHTVAAGATAREALGSRMFWILAAALLCFAACGKNEDGASNQPTLATPVAVEKVPAQAEVKASSGPIELAFLLHKTEIKAGDYLWQQIRIRNVGDREIVVADQVFHDPWELRHCSRAGYGIYLEALGPDGAPMKVQYQLPADPGSDQPEAVSGLLEVEGPKEQAMLDSWRKQGLSLREINTKLIEFNMKKQRAAEIHQRRPIIKLLPGQSAETKSAFFYSMTDKRKGRSVPKPIGDFTQIDFFRFDEPGQYKVRAVYDHLPGDLTRKYKSLSSPDDVLIRTPWVPVTVQP
ncbi:MAG: hypothetical protein ABL955_03860, partial [Elusimicrobiota bacterium]